MNWWQIQARRLAFLLLAAKSIANAVDPPQANIRLNGDKYVVTQWRSTGPTRFEFESPELTASIVDAGGGQWTFELNPRQSVQEVWFPWEPQQIVLNSDMSDDVVLTPKFGGTACRMDSLMEWGWNGNLYPGVSFSPLLIVTDRRSARVAAATNWPPRNLTPMYSRNRITLVSHEPLPPGRKQTYSILYASYPHDAAAGGEPWQKPVEVFREWLQGKLRAEKLFPPRYSATLQETPGWLNVQLQNSPRFDPRYLEQFHERWHGEFPWIQFWGQMSNYTGEAHLARPAVKPGEECGCCVGRRELHARYRPDLPRLIDRFRAAGTRVGFYARPRDPLDLQRLDDPTPREGVTHLDWMREWVRQNRDEYLAEGIYLDTIGNVCFAATPLFVARVLGEPQFADAIVEGVEDLYPSAFLGSGFLGGGFNVGERGKPAEANKEPSFVRFSRYLLNEHVFFFGESNGDHKHWGAANDHRIEREAFLLGAKLDVITPTQKPEQTLGPVNAALGEILTAWREVGFWQRRPVYEDTRGIRNVSPGVRVRRFRGSRGEVLLAIENWSRAAGQQAVLDGAPIAIPTRRLSIMVVGGGD